MNKDERFLDLSFRRNWRVNRILSLAYKTADSGDWLIWDASDGEFSAGTKKTIRKA
jgi:hypothetical protein